MADTETDYATAVGALIKARATKAELATGLAEVDFYGGGLPIGANLADYTASRVYAVSSATAAASITPAIPAVARNIGVMEVLRGSSGGYYHYRWTVIGGGHRGVYEIDYQQGTWTDWRKTDGDNGGPSAITDTAIESAERHTRADQARQRVGGRIGTSGLPTLALRFDDWADEMETIIMPELRARNLPAGWAATVAYVETHSTQTWATIQQWVTSGVELLGHSWTHTNATGTAGLHKEIIESADYIESKVPDAAIDTWVMPGILDGIATYDNFGSANVPENFYLHEAGRMILRRYPVVNGEVPGRHAPLVGQPAMGQKHGTVEYDTLPQAKAELQAAMDAGTGVTLMAHPAKLGLTDRMSVADFLLFLDWVVELRDSEQLLVLTPRGQAHADRDAGARLNLMKNGDFRNGLTGWSNTTGWSVVNAGARSWATTTTGAALEQAIPAIECGYLRGGVVEIAALVRAPDAVARVRTAMTGVSAVHTVNPADGWKWVRTVTTIPRTLGDADSLTAYIGRWDGGAVDVAHATVRPV